MIIAVMIDNSKQIAISCILHQDCPLAKIHHQCNGSSCYPSLEQCCLVLFIIKAATVEVIHHQNDGPPCTMQKKPFLIL